MRYLVIILFCFIVQISFGKLGYSTMKFENKSYDFEKIAEDGGDVICRFKFKNIGDKPFVIERVAVSCGCTSPYYPKVPIMPGDTSSIVVRFDPVARIGIFRNYIVVTSNDRKNRNQLIINGEVISKYDEIE